MKARFCMQCQRDVIVLDLLAWKAIYNKAGKITRRVCPKCAAGKKQFDGTGVYKRT